MKYLLNLNSILNVKLILVLLILNISHISFGQVKVNEDSNVGIGGDPIAETNYSPKLTIKGRASIAYPSGWSGNIFLGYKTGTTITGFSSIRHNIIIGKESGQALSSGSGNIINGWLSGNSISSGSSNIVIGSFSGGKIATSAKNIILGTSTGNNLSGNFNLIFGNEAGSGNSGNCTGSFNTMIGDKSGFGITGNSFHNLAIGSASLGSGTLGAVVISNNTAVGFQALKYIKSNSKKNVAIGSDAGQFINGTGNVFIGYKTGPATPNAPLNQQYNISNQLFIDNINTATPLIHGNFSSNIITINGNLTATGTITAPVKNFKIDHPLSPETKSLHFASIEAPEMINMFRGNITTDKEGFATVTLPNYFSAANIDCSYHLTCIGVFAQAIVSQKVKGNTFVIQTDQPNVEVSWQLLAKRNDTWAKNNPLIVEQEK